jgi:hypothetical protein
MRCAGLVVFERAAPEGSARAASAKKNNAKTSRRVVNLESPRTLQFRTRCSCIHRPATGSHTVQFKAVSGTLVVDAVRVVK